MERTKIMVNGLPGAVAVIVANHLRADDRFELIPVSLTGPEIEEKAIDIGGVSVRLVRPEDRDAAAGDIRDAHGSFISVDYTHPSAVKKSASRSTLA